MRRSCCLLEAADPAMSTKLVDRLKDLKLQGFWLGALKLFDKGHANGRTSKWQSFHYALLLDLLCDAHQWPTVQRVWEHMKQHHFLAVDAQVANNLLFKLGRTKEHEMAKDVMHFMADHQLQLSPSGMKAAMYCYARDGQWIKALEFMQQLPPKPDATGEGINRAQLNALLRAMRDTNAVLATMSVMKEAPSEDLRPDATSYGALVDALPTSQWEEAVVIYQSAKDKVGMGLHSPFLFNATMSICARARQSSLSEAVFQEMKRAGVEPTGKTLEVLCQMYERQGRWDRVLETYKTFAEDYPIVKGTNQSYSAVVKALGRAGMNAEALRIFDEMRSKGLKGNSGADVALINAWTSAEMVKKRRRKF